MKSEGNAIVYCEGAFNTPNGKTAHGLIRFCHRYAVIAVVDSRYAGRDAGEVLDGKVCNIPVMPSIEAAMQFARESGMPPTHLVVGIAPDGGRLGSDARRDVLKAIQLKLNVDCGLHDFLSDDPEFSRQAEKHAVTLRDIRKPPGRDRLHFFSGNIETVDALKIAVLGTDSAVGKRTTAWLIVNGLRARGISAELIGTGQTAWMQGARFGVVMDALVNDFVSGEIEHAVCEAWEQEKPQVIVLEGQGSLLNPAYPGGFELLSAGRPDFVVLQHAPARKEYDSFPGFPIQPLAHQIAAIELISDCPVAAVTINHEDLPRDKVPLMCETIASVTGLPAVDVLLEGADRLVDLVEARMKTG